MFKVVGWAARTVLGIGVIVGLLVFFVGPQRAAAFTSTAFSVVGVGTGITLASIPDFAEGVGVGQDSTDTAYKDSMQSKLRGYGGEYGTDGQERSSKQDRADRQSSESNR